MRRRHAIELRQSGENSVLSSVALSVSDSLTQVLRWVYWWNSTEAIAGSHWSPTTCADGAEHGFQHQGHGERRKSRRSWRRGRRAQSAATRCWTCSAKVKSCRKAARHEEEAELIAKEKPSEPPAAVEPPMSAATTAISHNRLTIDLWH